MGEWNCEQSAVTKADRMTVWSYWTDMDNHKKAEPGVERIELDGPFVTGTTGRTITNEYQNEWELTDVVEGSRFGITGYTPDRQGTLSFSWVFDDVDDGTRITYRIDARGPQVEEYMDVLRQMELNAPRGLQELAATLDRLAPPEP